MFNKLIPITLGVLCVLTGTLKAQQQLTILKAIYTGGDVQRDVTPVLTKQVRDGEVQFEVSNEPLGGDPCFGKVKTLTVLYRNASGDFTITANEGERLIIPNLKALPLSATNNQASVNQNQATNLPQSTPVESTQSTASRLAPDGIYYLVERVKVRTSDGLIALPPGTRVERVSDSITTLKVKAGEQEFEVSKSSLTNDLDVAKARQAGHETTQAQLRAAATQTMDISAEGNHVQIHGIVVKPAAKGLLIATKKATGEIRDVHESINSGSHYVSEFKKEEVYVTVLYCVWGIPNSGYITPNTKLDMEVLPEKTDFIDGAQVTIAKYIRDLK